MSDSRKAYRGVILGADYENAGAMIEWLARVFGLRERARYVDKDGNVMQAEMYIGETPLWFSGHGPGYWERKGHGPDPHLLVLVEDADAHHARVTAADLDAKAPEDRDYGTTCTASRPRKAAGRRSCPTTSSAFRRGAPRV